MKLSGLAALAATLLTLGLLVAGAGVLLLVLPGSDDAAPVRFCIAPGERFAAVSERLAACNLIPALAPLALWARLTGSDRQIQAGCYDLSPAASPLEVLATLCQGRVVLARVTLPEGLTAWQTLEVCAGELDVPHAELQACARDEAWLARQRLPETGVEGYLFPETYHFAPGVGAVEVLDALVGEFWRRFDMRRQARAVEIGWSVARVVTLASIIEAEVTDPAERRRVAAVYHNRLAAGWRLEADPTVAYAVRRPGRRLTRADLAVDSPYNTYRHYGLPPGPICSPGLASLDAALWPLENCRDRFFVARGDGTHVFSSTLEAHRRAVREMRRRRPSPR